LGEASAPGRSEAADRDAQPGRREFVRRPAVVGVRHQHPQHLLAAQAQAAEGQPQLGVAVGDQQRPLRVVARAGRPVQHPRVTDHLEALGPAQRGQRLVPAGGADPGTEPGRIAQRLEVLQDPQPGLLEDVGGVGRAEAVVPADRPHPAAEPLHDPVPGLLVPADGVADQPGQIVGGRTG
jgi:hypothetical protein